MSENIKFTACKYLMYKDLTHVIEKRAVLLDEIKVYHHRPDSIAFDGNNDVQFCKKRGRLNSKIACLNHSLRVCQDYEDAQHVVFVNGNKVL